MVRQTVSQALKHRAPSPYGLASPIVAEYETKEGYILRRAQAGRFSSLSRMLLPETGVTAPHQEDNADSAAFWNALLLGGGRPLVCRAPERPTVSVVDLFSGCGGLSLGVKRAAEAVGVQPLFSLAVDVAPAALRVYTSNLRPVRSARQCVETLVDYGICFRDGSALPDIKNAYLASTLGSLAGSVDLFIAGPPCEGNSNLNNRTRRSDPRNDLYLHATIAGIALGAKVIVIENVPMVTRSHQDVIGRSLRLLRDAGYHSQGCQFSLLASDFGTAQARRRHFLIAGRSGRALPPSAPSHLKVRPPTVTEALLPLLNIDRSTTFDQPSKLSKENKRRIQVLADTGAYDLPDRERPDCHRLKDHSYPAIYGRMRPGEPAPTITTGFLSPGRGRFTHPLEPRSLTPHEGARLQGFGEDFNWLTGAPAITRSQYASMIGSAVPPPLGFVVGMCALSLL